MHDEEFKIFNLKRYSFVGTILWSVWNWSHRSFVSCVTLKESSNILFHVFSEKIFPLACHFVTAVIACLTLFTSN